jgi:ABC-type ATPase with predicted acetyltransferase domain
MRLAGCVRGYSLVSNGFSCVTEQILGEKTFSEMLHKLRAQRTETVEIGRWIVHPAYRASGRPGIQLAAASAALLINA